MSKERQGSSFYNIVTYEDKTKDVFDLVNDEVKRMLGPEVTISKPVFNKLWREEFTYVKIPHSVDSQSVMFFGSTQFPRQSTTTNLVMKEELKMKYKLHLA